MGAKQSLSLSQYSEPKVGDKLELRASAHDAMQAAKVGFQSHAPLERSAKSQPALAGSRFNLLNVIPGLSTAVGMTEASRPKPREHRRHETHSVGKKYFK
eukprot:NODE_12965_length_492_cov_32.560976_g12672_i0.p1 GENE.NODE_12965_length_492_cov_32.560976_g12672_i0~~NODE_12965_length_492_cov_32.560976_g12672_i0.p1  ORF type:complete len:114 (-),score=28.14 NODE_12965_length_492_cov_32.560976_g12672_i0:149-448(-)